MAACCQGEVVGPSLALEHKYPPINYFYTHFHNSIKAELDTLTNGVRALETTPEQKLQSRLQELREHYRFLEQIYKYHSSVEDEVVYPALDSKVKNVTYAYSVEHQDEELRFEQMSQLLSTALSQTAAARAGTIRKLMCKAQEIHTTWKKHLAKEEEQLLPLLLQHFSFNEQAEMVAQFLYCIPLATVDRVLLWLKPTVPEVEQEHLMRQIQQVVSDQLLLQLVGNWLKPQSPTSPASPMWGARRRSSSGGGAAPASAAAGSGSQQHQNLGACSAAAVAAAGGSAAAEASDIECDPIACCGHPESCRQATRVGTLMLLLPATADHPAGASGGAHLVAVAHSAVAAQSVSQQGSEVAGPGSAMQQGQGEGADSGQAAACAGRQCSQTQQQQHPQQPQQGCSRCSAEPCPSHRNQQQAQPQQVQRLLAKLSSRPALREIVHFHRSITSALDNFAKEARALQQSTDVTAGQVSSLVERHRFLRSVCMFHTISEEEVMVPAVERINQALGLRGGDGREDGGEGGGPGCTPPLAPLAYPSDDEEHKSEVALFENLGRLLADVRAFARRGRKEVFEMLDQLCRSALSVSAAMEGHMRREEAEMLPLLEAHLCQQQQRAMVWRTVSAMPLRLLERVMPWIVASLSDEDASVLLTTIQLGAPARESVLVELLCRWAARGRHHLQGQAQAQGQGPTATATAQQPGAGGSGGAMEAEAATAPAGGCGSAGVPGSGGCGRGRGRLPVRQASSLSGNLGDGPLRRDWAAGDHCMHSPSQQEAGAAPAEGSSEVELLLLPPGHAPPPAKRRRLSESSTDEQILDPMDVASTAPAESLSEVELLQPALHAPMSRSSSAGMDTGGAATATASAAVLVRSSQQQQNYNPIDHIFQFHKALRRELRQLEADALALEAVVVAHMAAAKALGEGEGQQAGTATGTAEAAEGADPLPPQPGTTITATTPTAGAAAAAAAAVAAMARTPSPSPALAAITAAEVQAAGLHRAPGLSPAPGGGPARLYCHNAVQQLDGRFQFLWGIYRAHSHSEDEIVFPALESKHALRNISHAYTLDHQAEEQLFIDLDEMLTQLKASRSAAEASELAMVVRRMCAAVRASLETHIRSEESELWPLFSEHFSHEEQQYLVGVIIGRTGATVLQQLLPWVSDSFSSEEKNAMMDSLRAATKNTMFDQWMEAIQGAGRPPVRTASEATAAAKADVVDGNKPLSEVMEYLAGTDVLLESHGTIAESSSFRPGWEDIFRMNQQQLEAAIHRVSNDPSLEPNRKAYLIQNILVSKYIVAQQRRMEQPKPQAQAAGGEQACCSKAGPPLHPEAGHSSLQQRQGRQQGEEQRGPVPGTAGAGAGAGSSTCGCSGGSAGGNGGSSNGRFKTYCDASGATLGCKHYQRKCQLVAPCCGGVYTCRLCHNEARGHRMDRYAVEEMVCMECGLQQPVAQACAQCATRLARYYCSICHLFDDEPGRDIYHCPFCNVCRRGKGLGVDFFHCMHCNACMSLSLFHSHKCREKCMEGNCPVCSDYLFDSSQPIKELPCGHFMHSSCFVQYTQYNYTCPLCSKSIGDMTVYFQMLDSLLAAERLPAEYAGRMQQVLCHDCGKMGFAPFHFVYHSCPHCRSYNTRVL